MNEPVLLEQITKELTELLLEKRRAYGDAFKDAPRILQLLYPSGVQPDAYEDLLTIVRILDKLYRIANRADTEDPWQDIAGYAILALEKRNVSKKN
tara:strand:- start:127 stop:414 length:288 start_codon:yes stop_codon:yes gene_type:complete